MRTPIRCPQCRSISLELIELWKDHSIIWQQDDQGLISSKGILEPGNPYRVEAECRDCKHTWKVRRITQITDLYPAYLRNDTCSV